MLLKGFVGMARNQFGRSVIVIRSDKGLEFNLAP